MGTGVVAGQQAACGEDGEDTCITTQCSVSPDLPGSGHPESNTDTAPCPDDTGSCCAAADDEGWETLPDDWDLDLALTTDIHGDTTPPAEDTTRFGVHAVHAFQPFVQNPDTGLSTGYNDTNAPLSPFPLQGVDASHVANLNLNTVGSCLNFLSTPTGG